ncbi:MAG: glycerophosphodiester phosphodiesterase [Arachnia sp.]
MAVVYGDYLSPEFVAMAHRGGSLLTANLGIENTVRAFANAVELGFTYLETDVHATADGELVAFHDPNLERVTGYDSPIHDLTLAEVLELRVGDREPIPTLAELLETFPDARFNIDIKHPAAMEPLVDAIVRHAAQRRVCVGSFSRQCLRRFRARIPEVPTSVSTVGVAALAFGQMPPNGQVFQMPMSYPIGPVNVDLITPRTIERIHATGRKVHAWTIDDPTTMHQLIDWGVDGIITDRPDSLKDVLSARGMWSTR